MAARSRRVAREGKAQLVRSGVDRVAVEGDVEKPDALACLSTLAPVLTHQPVQTRQPVVTLEPVQTLAIFAPRPGAVKSCHGRRGFPNLGGLPVRSKPKPAGRQANRQRVPCVGGDWKTY